MKRYRFAFFIFMLLPLYFACRRGPEVVIKIGSQQVTVEEVMPILEKQTALNRGEVNESKVKEYLEGLYSRDLYYLEEAKSMGLMEEDSIRKKILNQQKKTLTRPQGPLYEVVVADVKPPTAEQLSDLYDKRLWQYKLAHILLPTKELADSVFQKLAKGASFAKLVQQYSFDRRWGDETGEWKDWFLYGTMGGDFDDKVVSAMPLRPIAPIHTIYGYQIVMVLKKKERPERPFNKVTDWLTNVYNGMERRRAFFHYQNRLPARYQFKVNEETARLVTGIYKENEGLPHLDGERLSGPDRDAVLASYRGGRLLLEDFVTYYNSQRPLNLPPLSRLDAVAEYAKTAAMTDLMYLDALEKGLDADKDFQRAARQYRVNTLRTEVYKQLYQPFEITEDEKVQRYQADSTFHIQPYQEAAKWVERAIRTEKMNQENKRQLQYLKAKYPIEFCEKGVDKILQRLQN